MAHVEKFQAAALGNMCAHYERRAERDNGYERANIDPSRTHENYNLGPERDMSQVEFIQQRIDGLDLKRKPRKDAVRMCDCVITVPRGLGTVEHRAFFESAYRALAERYGDENVVSSWVHLDEPGARPHMHFAWVPVTKDGRLSAKDVVSREDLQGLHGHLQERVEKDLGHHVEVLLDDPTKREKGVYLEFAEFRDMTEQLEKMRLERDEARSKVVSLCQERDSLVEEVKGLRTALNELTERFETLLRHVAEIAETMKHRPFMGAWKQSLEALKDNPIARAAVEAGRPWVKERHAIKAEKEIKRGVDRAAVSLDEMKREYVEMSRRLRDGHWHDGGGREER